MSSVEVYNKEILDDEIRRLITVNVQLVIDKIETEKVKVIWKPIEYDCSVRRIL